MFKKKNWPLLPQFTTFNYFFQVFDKRISLKKKQKRKQQLDVFFVNTV